MKLLHGLCLSSFNCLFVSGHHKRNLTGQYSRIMQKFPGSSKIFPIFDSKMSNVDINLFERERQTNKKTNPQTSHHGATEGRDGMVHGEGGGGRREEQPRPQGFRRKVGGVINRPLIFNLR